MSLTIFPSIDLRDGKVVRLQQGDFSRQISYDLSPVEVAKSFERDGAGVLHVVDLDGAKAGRIEQIELIRTLAGSTNLTLQAGGGVRSSHDVDLLIKAGVHRVVVGTAAFNNWTWFLSLVQQYPGAIVLAIDAKDGMIATHGWTQTSSLCAIDVAREVNDLPLAALLYTDVAKDGMLQGPNVIATADLARATRVPVLASGGVGTLDHIRALLPAACGADIAGVILGRSLHDGHVKLVEAIALTR